MVNIMENPVKMVDLGGKPTIFGNIHLISVRLPDATIASCGDVSCPKDMPGTHGTTTARKIFKEAEEMVLPSPLAWEGTVKMMAKVPPKRGFFGQVGVVCAHITFFLPRLVKCY